MSGGHVFILGGARSGKTGLAEGLAQKLGERPAYLATAEALDDEMAERVAAHKRQRRGQFTTIEEPLDLADAVRMAALHHDVILVDCLTLWMSNLLAAERDVVVECDQLLSALDDIDMARVILVSNEVGLGIVPDNGLARSFRDLAGWTHQRVAASATHVYFVVSGLPMVLKGNPPETL